MPVSAAQQAKRAFVAVINALAGRHGVEVRISRHSPDADLRSAYRKVSFRVHPDRSGHGEDQKRLNAVSLRVHPDRNGHDKDQRRLNAAHDA